ncbi:hypothetical protein JR316_0009517 [Psilocybe cubensis]|uniref:Uncharacterized protein n=2 Tax=Psilocybe cubensis TaxID=181762 RepID=A0ACB8GP37_PSICU|nr:hypothetical protein JR316_0009517 [Psilocybe cubensis]KAH9477313.1 hypothetical protein JR316_0009517 [Psilocybe cubensis]
MILQDSYNQESRAHEDETADDDTATAVDETDQEEIVTEPMWLAEHGPIALKVYKDVWTEFYEFETQYCKSVLKNLSRGGPGRHKQDPPAISAPIYVPSNSNYTCQIVDLSDDGHTMHVTTRPMDPTVLDDSNFTIPEPYPKYTTCTPLSHNVRLLNPDMDTRAPFLPYADEPEFLKRFPDYLDDFDVFAWQVDLDDPDREMIEVEAARRLYMDHGYSYEEIDKFGMFKHAMLVKSKESLVWHASHRDPFRWPGGTSTLVPSQDRDASDKDSSSSLSHDGSDNALGDQSTSKIFPENTINHSATFYDEVVRDKPQPIVPPKATVKGSKMLQGKGKACGVNCFKTVNILSADQMYIERINILPDDDIKPERDSEPRPTFAFDLDHVRIKVPAIVSVTVFASEIGNGAKDHAAAH